MDDESEYLRAELAYRRAQLREHQVRFDEEPLLAAFEWDQLRGDQAAVVRHFGELARRLVLTVPKNRRRTEALTYLVQAQAKTLEALS